MNFLLRILVAMCLLQAIASPVNGQIVVGSFERRQPLLLCGGEHRLSDDFMVPFNMVNIGSLPVVIDSVIATGDTSDFYSNLSNDGVLRWLNPIDRENMWGATLQPKQASLGSFAFSPSTSGKKQLILTVFYRQNDQSFTTQGVILYHTAEAPQGLAFLATTYDTVRFLGSTAAEVTSDRSLLQDTLFQYVVVRPNKEYRNPPIGFDRVDLVSCGATRISRIELEHDAGDSMAVLRPTELQGFDSGDTILFRYSYLARPSGPAIRSAIVRIIPEQGAPLVLKLTLQVQGLTQVEAPQAGSIRLLDRIWPNPARQRITVQSTESSINLRLYDQRGTIVMEQMLTEPNTATVSIEGLPSGGYFLQAAKGNRVEQYPLRIIQ